MCGRPSITAWICLHIVNACVYRHVHALPCFQVQGVCMVWQQAVPVHISIADSVMHIIRFASFCQVHKQGSIHNELLAKYIFLYANAMWVSQLCRVSSGCKVDRPGCSLVLQTLLQSSLYSPLATRHDTHETLGLVGVYSLSA